MALLIQVKRWLVNISVRTTVRHCIVPFASSLFGESDFLRASHYFISLVARHSWGCSPMKFLSSGKPEITFIGYWLSHLQASPLSYGTEYLSEPLPPGKCFMQCWPPQPVSSSFITPYTSGWEIMHFGWLSSSTYLCAASCRQF